MGTDLLWEQERGHWWWWFGPRGCLGKGGGNGSGETELDEVGLVSITVILVTLELSTGGRSRRPYSGSIESQGP